MILYGRKCISALGKLSGNQTLERSITGANPKNFDELAQSLCEDLVVRLGENRFSKVLVCYNQYVSAMTQTPTHRQVLPMKIKASEEASEEESSSKAGDYIYEPSGGEILGAILPMVLQSQILQAFLETEAGEQAARMQAMDNATRNAGELIDKLTLKYNRARQAAITKELIEIISGAEAL